MAGNIHKAAQIAIVGASQSVIEHLVALDQRLTSGSFVPDFRADQDGIDQCAGFLLAGGRYDAAPYRATCSLTREFLRLECPVLAFGTGAHVLNEALGGLRYESRGDAHGSDGASDQTQSRHTVFLTVGSKTAMTIGGSGWVTIRYVALNPLPLSHLSGQLMPAAITESSDVIAFEVPGHSWTIGVTWDLTQVDRLPSGFGNIYEAFVDRTVG